MRIDELTKDIAVNYLAGDGSECPYCGSQDTDTVSSNDNIVGKGCNICKKNWYELWKLVGIGSMQENKEFIP